MSERKADRMSMPFRHLFLDLFRGGAVLLMLEGHFVRLVLAPSWKESFGWSVHKSIHGITAPAFLFGAGFTLAVTAGRSSLLLTEFSQHFWHRVARALLLVLIGYGLAVPAYSLSQTLTATTSEQ